MQVCSYLHACCPPSRGCWLGLLLVLLDVRCMTVRAMAVDLLVSEYGWLQMQINRFHVHIPLKLVQDVVLEKLKR